MAAAKLGDGTCPLCGGTARVSLSKTGYAVMTMNCCNAQLFTRSPRSDELVRDRIKVPAPQAAQAAPAAPPAPTHAPAAVRLPEPAPARAAAPSIPPAPAPASSGFGLRWF